ncbi:peptidylprolyl isomerase [Nocardioides speluncae]|uniref:peptidylprolyl isomerase n=1 Tax=Nocardioides speluncae TaxID=2670337 RepID=UPI000D698222|nr:peptidylprolyl isomerase [Nocardioides speluncae]
MLKRLLGVLAALLALTMLVSCSDDGDDRTAKEEETSDTVPGSGESPEDIEPAGACEYVVDGSEPAKEATPPPADPAVTGKKNLTISTSAGDIKAVLDAGATPCTVNSFVSLAEQGYFDDTECHRLTSGGLSVLQCGDPTATGTGGPGYSFADELTGKETYPAGTLAMANAGPDTNGSQFFIVYKDSGLPPAYAVFGKVDTASIRIVQAIAAKGTDTGGPDGAPKEKVAITSVK